MNMKGVSAAARVGRGHSSETPVPARLDLAQMPRSPAHTLQGLRVLAVEDQSDMREYLERKLEERGATVVTASWPSNPSSRYVPTRIRLMC